MLTLNGVKGKHLWHPNAETLRFAQGDIHPK